MTCFADQFKLFATLRNALAEGRVQLCLRPTRTTRIENARETRHWLTTLAPGQPEVLITSQFHMPRASLALEQAVRGRQVLRYGVTEDTVRYESVMVEFWKYLGTYVVGWGG